MNISEFNKKEITAIFASLVFLAIVLFWTKIEVFVLNIARAPDIIFFLRQDADSAFRAGNYYFNVGGMGKYDLEKAEEYFNKALLIDPAVPDAWHQLARIDFLRGNFFAALQKINKQIELHGDSLMSSYYIRGLIYGYSREFEKAELDFLKFFEWDRKNWAAYNDLAWVYFQQGEYEKTRRVADGGLAYFPDNPWLLNMAGLARMNLGDKPGARVYFQKSLWFTKALTESDWNKAYPGNDPRIALQGILEMKNAINFNIDLSG